MWRVFPLSQGKWGTQRVYLNTMFSERSEKCRFGTTQKLMKKFSVTYFIFLFSLFAGRNLFIIIDKEWHFVQILCITRNRFLFSFIQYVIEDLSCIVKHFKCYFFFLKMLLHGSLMPAISVGRQVFFKCIAWMYS